MFKKINTHVLLSLLTFAVSQAVANGLITNTTGKDVTGFGGDAVALGLLIYGAWKHHSDAKVTAAQIVKGVPTT